MFSRLLISFSLLIKISTSATAQLSLQPFVPNATEVTAITHCGDERLFFLEQSGLIRVADSQGNLLPDTFLNIVSRVGTATGERGLLGIAFSPDYATGGYFYLNYTNTLGNTTVSRFRASSLNPQVADSASEEILLTISQPYSNHNGGDMHSGPMAIFILRQAMVDRQVIRATGHRTCNRFWAKYYALMSAIHPDMPYRLPTHLLTFPTLNMKSGRTAGAIPGG